MRTKGTLRQVPAVTKEWPALHNPPLTYSYKPLTEDHLYFVYREGKRHQSRFTASVILFTLAISLYLFALYLLSGYG